jgi:CheY-like chemotaxis protein
LGKLSGQRVLIVEDEYFIAGDLTEELVAAGAEIAGPAASAAEALPLIDARQVNLAVLDINLKGEMSFVIADALAARGIPFIFATGYDHKSVPARFADRALLQKPVVVADVVTALASAVQN